MRVNLERTVRSLFRAMPNLPQMSGDVLVFGSAPDPHVPADLLQSAQIVTANASQITLESYGVKEPHVTLMRNSMGDDRPTSVMKRGVLTDRRTGLLIVEAPRRDPTCAELLSAFRDINYQFDDLLVLDRLDYSLLHNFVLHSGQQVLQRKYGPSMGLRSIMTCLAMGAERVVVSGISLQSRGCSFSDLDYQRNHIDEDRVILDLLLNLDVPVYLSDPELQHDTGLRVWPPSWGLGLPDQSA